MAWILCASALFTVEPASAAFANPATGLDDDGLAPPIVIDLEALRRRGEAFGPQIIDGPRIIDAPRFVVDASFISGILPGSARLALVDVPPWIDEAVAALDSPDWTNREQAAQALFDGADVDEPIMSILDRGTLAAEQHHRLLDILCRRLATSARGALGIRMQFVNDGRPGVVVMDTLPGMPAEKLLRPDDRIMAIDGRPVFDSAILQSIIMVERPGRKVALEIDRPRRGPDGRELRDPFNEPIADRITIDMTLGSSDDLDRFDQGFGGQAALLRARRGGARLGDARLGDGLFAGGGNARVAALRQAQVEEATIRFGPGVVKVNVANRHTPPPSATDLDDLDGHPALRSLLVYRELVAEGAVRVTPALVDSWTRTLIELRQQADAPDIPEPLREYLRAVADRYAAMMPR